jgi:hypothetical protein
MPTELDIVGRLPAKVFRKWIVPHIWIAGGLQLLVFYDRKVRRQYWIFDVLLLAAITYFVVVFAIAAL